MNILTNVNQTPHNSKELMNVFATALDWVQNTRSHVPLQILCVLAHKSVKANSS